MAVAPVQPGSPIFTFSAKLQNETNDETTTAMIAVFIIFIISPLFNLNLKI